MTDHISTAQQEFLALIGAASEAEGKSRISGQIIALLVFEGRALSFGELAVALGVSRGSISTNTRTLEARGVLARVQRSGERQDYFELVDVHSATLLREISQRLDRTGTGIEDICARLSHSGGDSGHGACARLRDYAAFHHIVAKAIATASDEIEGKTAHLRPGDSVE
ncbi:hypothetical protein AQS8620_02433 [Aquimixticola soesokkakensis]|uniref:HTH marR-type domain-containing protein n=1 Tax=Aquimixticola soesokkakensis TaxID=1519096 RepID=A0A1Y5T9M8_9RHOB|nr:MarR family transcriptional regulator [Aquimixticola soesokkakensis]SLN55427.1 hypothetical protein AQS8620_02433 [Aquimixticola soesokkakensis]